MANELRARYPSGKTLYGVLVRWTDGAWYNTGTPGFESPLAANWTHYAVSLTELSAASGSGPPGVYYGNLPSGLSATGMDLWVYVQAGGGPADTDAPGPAGIVGQPDAVLSQPFPADFAALDIDSSGNLSLTANGLNNVLVAGVELPTAIKYIGAAVSGGSNGVGTSVESYNDFSGALAFSVTFDSNNNRLSVTYH